jgi:hypothetical protein
MVLSIASIAVSAQSAAAQFPPGKVRRNPCRPPSAGVATAQSEQADLDAWQLSDLPRCGAPSAAIAAKAWPLLRSVTDSATLVLTTGFWRYADARVLNAALAVARDRGAAPPARVYALMNAFVIGAGDNIVPDLATLGAGADCGTSYWPHLGRVRGSPPPADVAKQVHSLAAAIASDQSEAPQVRAAAACVAMSLDP